MEITLIQTLRDKGNAHIVERDGPFKCTKPHAWLGHGYYFWDTYVELGHWWGQSAYGTGNYFVCEANGVLDKFCWDLHGNQRHLSEFKYICEEIIKSGISNYEKLKVPEVIEFVKKRRSFNYKSIRALGLRSISNNSDFYHVMTFVPGLPSHLDLLPPIQICLLEKTALSLNNYRVIFPEEYA